MTAEELEELLSPKPKATSTSRQAVTVDSNTVLNRANFATSSIAPGQYNLNTSLNMYGGRRSDTYNARALSSEDKSMIMNAIISDVNSEARGLRYDLRDLEALSRRMAAFTEAYMYRYFPYMIHPKIECKVDVSPWDAFAQIDIIVNDFCIGAMGVSTR